ncbi:MAG: 5-formyltetrahydrofolate cyclo-ligase [Bacteroidota bacterium]
MSYTKQQLRQAYKAKRFILDLDKLETLGLVAINRVLDLPIWEYTYFHLFLPIDTQNEINTLPLLSILQGRDKSVVLSKVCSQSELKHYLLEDSTVLRKNQWGIPEPVEGLEVPENRLDVVFVPLLAFDSNGHRVGYGNGYYDRFLKKCRTDTLKIGLSLFPPELPIEDITEMDIALDYCLTPDQSYTFK